LFLNFSINYKSSLLRRHKFNKGRWNHGRIPGIFPI
jgi:hypothetical protein